MKKDNESENHSNSEESTEDNQEDNKSSGKKAEKVMVPFFGEETPEFNVALKPEKVHPSRKHKFNKSDNYLPRNRNFNANKLSPQPPKTKEVGVNGEQPNHNKYILKPFKMPPDFFSNSNSQSHSHSNFQSHPHSQSHPQSQPKNFRNSYHSLKAKGKKNFNENNGDVTPGRKFVYIDKSNVGNIRPLSSLYDKQSPPKAKPMEPARDHVVDHRVEHVGAFRHDYEYRHELKNPLNTEPTGPPLNFVDALIRNSNTFEDVLVDDSRSTSITTKGMADTNDTGNYGNNYYNNNNSLNYSNNVNDFNTNSNTNNSNTFTSTSTTNNTNANNRSNKSNKSQELKSVLTKMGILDKSQGPKDLPFKELENDLEKHYVFPKYMTSPDPSSIPIPGSL